MLVLVLMSHLLRGDLVWSLAEAVLFVLLWLAFKGDSTIIPVAFTCHLLTTLLMEVFLEPNARYDPLVFQFVYSKMLSYLSWSLFWNLGVSMTGALASTTAIMFIRSVILVRTITFDAGLV